MDDSGSIVRYSRDVFDKGRLKQSNILTLFGGKDEKRLSCCHNLLVKLELEGDHGLNRVFEHDTKHKMLTGNNALCDIKVF